MINNIARKDINFHMIALGTLLLLAFMFTTSMNYKTFSDFYFILTEEEKTIYLNDPATKSLLVGPFLCLIAVMGFMIRNKLGWFLTA